MKTLCNGFNLYGQLGLPDHLLDKFTQVFGGYLIDDICINHSFSVFKAKENCIIIYENKGKYINGCGNILKICSNDDRVVALNQRGKLFKINIMDTDKVCEIKLNEIADEEVINISTGSKLTLAYTNKGSLYNIPYKLNFVNENIVDVQCGREHSILLDKLGNVYTFGRGSRGQLGHGQLDDESEPVQVAPLGGIKIVQIAAGGWHSCAVSRDGDLYAWGWNGQGQLGLGKNDGDDGVSVMASPHVVDFPDPERNVAKVACGNRHTVVLLDNNHLFGCGWNKYKQLLNIDKENFNTFTYLHDFSNEEIVALKCGPWNSVILCK